MGCVPSVSLAETRSRHFHQAFKLGKKLGEGAFGQVRLAKVRGTEEERAVKIVDVRCMDCNGNPTGEAERGRLSAARGEIKVWEAIPVNDHCVHLQSSYFEKNIFYMVMERCQCSLMDKLSSLNTLVEGNVVRIFRDMLVGIHHIHEAGIVHRDVKPDNFLFGGPTGTVVKICDFGLAARKPKTGRLKGVFGTAPYMSPEMLQRKGYDELIDVWSFGATVFLIVNGDFPYSCRNPTPAAMKRMILEGMPEIRFIRDSIDDHQLFNGDFMARTAELLRVLLRRTPESRLTARQALQHPFFQNVQEGSSMSTTTPCASSAGTSVDEVGLTLGAPLTLELRKTTAAEFHDQEPGTPRKIGRQGSYTGTADTPSTMTGGAGTSCQASPASPCLEPGFAWGSAVTAEALGLHQVRMRLQGQMDAAADASFATPGRESSLASPEAPRQRELRFPSPRPWRLSPPPPTGPPPSFLDFVPEGKDAMNIDQTFGDQEVCRVGGHQHGSSRS